MASRARQVHTGDFEYFDYLIAMDRSNVADLHDLALDDAHRAKVRLLREFDPEADGDLDVPDPYYGGANGFVDVFDQIDEACRGLLDHLRSTS